MGYRGVPETPAQRSLRYARMAHQSWAQETGRTARTEPARAARERKFIDEARAMHPGATEEHVRQAAESLRKAFYSAMAYKSAKARQRTKAAYGLAAQANAVETPGPGT